MSHSSEWKCISWMARYSWKLGTAQVADAADKRISDLESEVASRIVANVMLREMTSEQAARISKLETGVETLKVIATEMEDFIDSCTYHMREGETVCYEGNRP